MKINKTNRMRKQDAILGAAIRLFLKHGYADTTMDAIALEAGHTKQTLYAYFPSKDDLFTRMIVYLCETHTPKKANLFPTRKSFEQLLYEQGSGLLSIITGEKVLATTRLVIAESGKYPKLAKLYYECGTQRMIQGITTFFDECNRHHLSAIPHTKSAASYFLALLKGQYYVRLILGIKPAPPKKSMDAHVRETVKIFLALYGGKSPLKTHSVL